MAAARERPAGGVVLKMAAERAMVSSYQPNHEEQTDSSLVRRARAGESGAFDALFRRHYSRVYNFALRMQGNAVDGEEIAQGAFVRAYGSLGRLRDGQAFLEWVFRIAVNLGRDEAKRRRRKPWLGFLDLRHGADEESHEPVEFADEHLDPARLTESAARERALLRAIRELPDEFREALVLHHLEGLDVRQIAAVTGAPEGTVKSRLGRARQRLRSALADWLDDGENQ